MKKLLILLFSLFFLSSHSVFADDISDFQIEGISIGDSLLDYMTEEEILKEIERNKGRYSYLKEPNKYAHIGLWKDFPIYDSIQFFIKNNSTNQYITDKNEKYTILYIRGLIDFTEDFDSCMQKRDEIVEVLSSMFSNVKKSEIFGEHPSDPSGDSIMDAVYFEFDSEAEIDAYCENIEETFRIKNNYGEYLNVSISTKEIASWLRGYQ